MGGSEDLRPKVAGYVLAGGKSSRMGRDKALVELAGKPLIEHAVTKLRRVCETVSVLSSNRALGAYGRLVSDIHPGCGPLGGFEAALSQSSVGWNLFYPVDMPFLPTAYLANWTLGMVTSGPLVRIGMFTVEGRPQPALALLHREVLPFIQEAIEKQEYKVYRALRRAGSELARRQGLGLEQVLRNLSVSMKGEVFATEPVFPSASEPWMVISEAQERARALWFANLNTPDELAEAKGHVEALDT